MVAALSRGGRINDTRVKDSCFKTIENCQKILKEKMEEQLKLEIKLAHINEKKPKKTELNVRFFFKKFLFVFVSGAF